jgi:hypothetical protein
MHGAIWYFQICVHGWVRIYFHCKTCIFYKLVFYCDSYLVLETAVCFS